MNLRRIEYFLAVVETGSISLAAARLHMTQPPLSQAILALERELGTELLVRLPRGVEPTAAGGVLAAQGRELLRWAERIEDQVRETGQGHEGRLLVASVPTFAWSHLPALLAEFRTEFPGVSVELADPAPLDVLRLVAAGGADVGFVAAADAAGVAAAYPRLEVTALVEMPMVLVVPETSARDHASARDFADHTWIIPALVPGFPGMVEIANALWRTAGFYPASVQTVATLQTALPLAAAGMGICLIPEAYIADIGGRFAVQPIVEGVPPLHGTLVLSRDIRPTPALTRLLGVVEHHFGVSRG